MIALGMIVCIACQVAAVRHAWLARRNVRPDVPGAAGRFWSRGAFAGPEIFTEAGWRHRNRALAWQWAGFAGFVLFLVLDSIV